MAQPVTTNTDSELMQVARGVMTLDVVYYREDPYWVAHCVQLDINASHPDREQTREMIINTIITQVCYAQEHELPVFRSASPEIMERMARAIRQGNPAQAVAGETALWIYSHWSVRWSDFDGDTDAVGASDSDLDGCLGDRPGAA